MNSPILTEVQDALASYLITEAIALDNEEDIADTVAHYKLQVASYTDAEAQEELNTLTNS